MHEMTIALNILEIALENARKEGAQSINKIDVIVGQLSGILVNSLNFCFDIARKDTLADSALLNIIARPGRGLCLECSTEFSVDSLYEPCPECGEFKVSLTQGKELQIRSINID
jgi:hydrogenase nickel incorporation protein HypA/HybF